MRIWFCRFYYYTAGSGGAGPTILATSFLLLGEEVVAYNKGQRTKSRKMALFTWFLGFHWDLIKIVNDQEKKSD